MNFLPVPHKASRADRATAPHRDHRSAHRKAFGVATSAALAAGLLTLPTAPAAYAAEKPGEVLRWGACPRDISSDPAIAIQCASFKVPLDYRKPNGKKITITMSRIKATGTARGVIFNNPGGPGGSSLNLWPAMLRIGSAPLHKHFDLISVQPRGLKYATPLKTCEIPPIPEDKDEGGIATIIKDIRNLTGKGDPNDPFNKAVDEYSKCLKAYNELSTHITTENTARDFDMARQYLGEQEINFYGASYGTWLGAVYATLFPEHTGRFVLDSAIDPEGVWGENFGAQGDMQRRRLYEMFDFIASNHHLYHLGDTPLKVYTRWYQIIEEEMQGPGVPRVSAPPAQIGDVPPIFKRNVQLYLQGYNLTRPIADRIERAIRAWQDPSTASNHNLWEITGSGFTSRAAWPRVAAYMQNPRPTPITKAEMEESLISSNVFTSVTCNENTIEPNDINLPIGLAAVFTGADYFTIKNLLLTSGILCGGITPSTKPIQVTGARLKTSPLVLQSVYDTQTPYAGGAKMAEMMNAHFVRTEGGDHGVYFAHNPAAWQLVNDYYLKSPVPTAANLPAATVTP